ncbi:uncharacterized protein IWZ02DRAFT_276399 [Phyllosticta citriasiana]|uniref:uncharacterized protein n=1 Tax=Phyllosticta citriasiana TaxID=595635 RepID=UPI0030FD4E82
MAGQHQKTEDMQTTHPRIDCQSLATTYPRNRSHFRFGPAGLYRRQSERLNMTHGTLLKHDAATGAPPFETLPDSGSACLPLLLGMFVKQKVFERIRLRGGHPTGSETTANGQSWAARRACFGTEFLARPGVVGSFFFFFFFLFYFLVNQLSPFSPAALRGWAEALRTVLRLR